MTSVISQVLCIRGERRAEDVGVGGQAEGRLSLYTIRAQTVVLCSQ